jgi:hypothetical protein
VTAAPTEPGRALAPIATTDRGAIILSRLRMDMALRLCWERATARGVTSALEVAQSSLTAEKMRDFRRM